MPNHFHVVRVHNQLRDATFNITLEIQRDDATGVDPGPVQIGPAQYKIPIVHPDDDSRHIALGKFMDAWSKLEISIRLLLMHTANIPMGAANVMSSALGTRGQIDVLQSIGPLRTPPEEHGALIALLDRLKTNNTRRNHIVHGFWSLQLVILNWGGRPGVRYHQYREYPSSSAEEGKALADPANRKLREKYLFSIPRINSITKEIERLGGDFDNFAGRCFRSQQNIGQ